MRRRWSVDPEVHIPFRDKSTSSANAGEVDSPTEDNRPPSRRGGPRTTTNGRFDENRHPNRGGRLSESAGAPYGGTTEYQGSEPISDDPWETH